MEVDLYCTGKGRVEESGCNLNAAFLDNRFDRLKDLVLNGDRSFVPEFDLAIEFGIQVGVAEAEIIKELLCCRNVIAASYMKIDGLEVHPDELARVAVDYMRQGSSRDAFLISPVYGDEFGSKERSPAPIVLKISKRAVSHCRGGYSQVVAYYANPDPEITAPVGGIWSTSDGRLAITEKYEKGKNCGLIFPPKKDEVIFHREIAAKLVRFWRKTGGYAVRDPHGANLQLLDEPQNGGPYDIKIIDTGEVERQDPRKFVENLFFWQEVVPRCYFEECMDPSQYRPPPETFSRRGVIEGVIEALGRDEGIRFLEAAVEDASPEKRTLSLKEEFIRYLAEY